MKWAFPREPNGNVTHYVVTWQKLPPDVQFISTDVCNPEAQSHLEDGQPGTAEVCLEMVKTPTVKPRNNCIEKSKLNTNPSFFPTGPIDPHSEHSPTAGLPTTPAKAVCDCRQVCESLKDTTQVKSAIELQRLEQIAFEDELINDMFPINPFAQGRRRKSFRINMASGVVWR